MSIRATVTSSLDDVQRHIRSRELPAPCDVKSFIKFREQYSLEKIVALLLQYVVKHTKGLDDEKCRSLLTQYVRDEAERLRVLADCGGYKDAAKIALTDDDVAFFVATLLRVSRALEPLA